MNISEKKKLSWHHQLLPPKVSTSTNSLWENYCDTDGGGTAAEADQSWPQQRRFGSATLKKSLHRSQRRTSIENASSIGTIGASGRPRQSI